MKYKLETDVSTFMIQIEPMGLWDLWVDGMLTLTFVILEEAAIVVYEQNSGYTIWDQLGQHSAPKDLSGWERIEE